MVSPPRADRLEVYDVDHQAHRLSVRAHGERVYYALSEQGELAVIDGARLRVFGVERVSKMGSYQPEPPLGGGYPSQKLQAGRGAANHVEQRRQARQEGSPGRKPGVTRKMMESPGGAAQRTRIYRNDSYQGTTQPILRGRHPDGRQASTRCLPGFPARAVFACWGDRQRASRPEGPCGSSSSRFCMLYRKVPRSLRQAQGRLYSDGEESASSLRSSG